MRSISAALLVCSIPFCIVPSLRAQWTCVALSPAGSTNSYATAVGGSRQGGYAVIAGANHAGVWTGSSATFVDLHPSGFALSRIYGVSNSFAVGYTYNGAYHAALWAGSSGAYTDIHPPSAASSVANAISGNRIVGVVDGHAAEWSAASASAWGNLNPPGYSGSSALAVAGQVIGGVAYPSIVAPPHAGVWIGAGFVDLHPSGAYSSMCRGVANGQQVGVVAGHAALWTGSAASFVDLHPSASLTSEAYAVFGGMQVGETFTISGTHAALWTGTAASHVDLHAFVPAGFVRSTATGIWSDGTTVYVTGHGVHGSYDRALLWMAPATPSLLAANTTLGSGCHGLSLGANTRPVLGTNWNLTVGGLPASAIFGVSVFGLSDPGILDLASYGMPGCQLRASSEAVLGLWTPTGATYGYGLALPPPAYWLLGLRLFTQTAALTAPPVNAAGAITSNGIAGTLGDL